MVQECLPDSHRLRLSASTKGPTNPGRTYLPQETLGLRRTGFSPVLSLLIPASSLPHAPGVVTVSLQRRVERSPTTQNTRRRLESVASVPSLSPVHFRRKNARPVSCYALFKWWLLLSQHPGCLGTLTSFVHLAWIRDLSRRSGLFPSRLRSLSLAVYLPGYGTRYSEFG